MRISMRNVGPSSLLRRASKVAPKVLLHVRHARMLPPRGEPAPRVVANEPDETCQDDCESQCDHAPVVRTSVHVRRFCDRKRRGKRERCSESLCKAGYRHTVKARPPNCTAEPHRHTDDQSPYSSSDLFERALARELPRHTHGRLDVSLATSTIRGHQRTRRAALSQYWWFAHWGSSTNTVSPRWRSSSRSACDFLNWSPETMIQPPSASSWLIQNSSELLSGNLLRRWTTS